MLRDNKEASSRKWAIEIVKKFNSSALKCFSVFLFIILKDFATTVECAFAKGRSELLSSFSPDRGHLFPVSKYVISSDGKKYATADSQGNLLILSTPDMKIVGQLKVSDGKITSMAFSDDGAKLIVGGTDKLATVWDVDAKTLLFRLDHGSLTSLKSAPREVAISHDCKVAYTVAENEILVWDLLAGGLIRKLSTGGVTAPIKILVPNYVLVGGTWRGISIWNGSDGKCIKSFNGADIIGNSGRHSLIHTINLVNEDRFVVAGTDDGIVSAWELATGKCVWKLATSANYLPEIAVSPDEKRLAFSPAIGTIIILDSRSGRVLSSLTAPRSLVTAITFSRDGRLVLSASIGRRITVFDSAKNTQVASVASHFAEIDSINAMADGIHFISETSDNKGFVWNVESGLTRGLLGAPSGRVMALQFSEDDNEIWIGSENLAFARWNVHSGEILSAMPDSNNKNLCVSFSPKGDKVATSLLPGRNINIFETSTGDLKSTIEYSSHDCASHPEINNDTFALTFCKDNQTLVVPGYDSTSSVLRVWPAYGGKPSMVFGKRHHGLIRPIVMSGDGKTVLVHSDDGLLASWDLKTFTLSHIFTENGGPFTSLSSSLNGEEVAAVGEDGILNYWRAKSGVMNSIGIKEFGSPVTCVSFDPGGTILAIACPHKIVCMDLRSKQKLREFKSIGWPLNTVAFSHDGKLLAGGSEDGSVEIWNLTEGSSRPMYLNPLKSMELKPGRS